VNGPDALAIAFSRRPDVIVADSHLPTISGYELCALLRRDLATRSTPIVLVTSDTMAKELEHARASGASSVMLKPCSRSAARRRRARVQGPTPFRARTPARSSGGRARAP
jgi:CheY-like chemotaxis protein